MRRTTEWPPHVSHSDARHTRASRNTFQQKAAPVADPKGPSLRARLVRVGCVADTSCGEGLVIR